MPASASTSGGVAVTEAMPITLIHDSLSFDSRQAKGIREMAKQVDVELKRQRREMEREVERIRDDFLKLYASDRVWGSEELLVDPHVFKRRGSTDILNPKKMRTLITETSDAERHYRLYFDISGFVPESVRVTADAKRIMVRAEKLENNGGQKGLSVPREYVRKIQKPLEVDANRLKSSLTSDGILLVEAPMLPSKIPPHMAVNSPAHSHHGGSKSSLHSKSSPNSPQATSKDKEKLGIPVFREEEDGKRRLHLAVEVGIIFSPNDITVQVIKENRILIKARHEERSAERLVKSKYSKEFELSEKIDTHSIRGGLTHDGRLIIGAFAKGHGDGKAGKNAGLVIVEYLDPKADLMPCNILDLAVFPPTMPESATSCSLNNDS